MIKTRRAPFYMSLYRPRISLVGALLLMTIVALTIVVALQWRAVGPLRAEIRRLRDDAGVLAIDDKSKIHVIRVDTRDKLAWKWRIWLPEGQAIKVHVTDDIAPKRGIISGHGTMGIHDPGEHVVQFRIDKDRRNDLWEGTLFGDNGSVGGYDQPWVTWKSPSTNWSGVGTKTRSFEPGKRIELIRHVVTESTAAGKPNPTTPASGFAIWIEPAK
jgi:hypothetical protein